MRRHVERNRVLRHRLAARIGGVIRLRLRFRRPLAEILELAAGAPDPAQDVGRAGLGVAAGQHVDGVGTGPGLLQRRQPRAVVPRHGDALGVGLDGRRRGGRAGEGEEDRRAEQRAGGERQEDRGLARRQRRPVAGRRHGLQASLSEKIACTSSGRRLLNRQNQAAPTAR